MASTVVELGQRVKQKYPGTYDDLPDAEVGRKVKAKFPGSYEDFADTPPAASRLENLKPAEAPGPDLRREAPRGSKTTQDLLKQGYVPGIVGEANEEGVRPETWIQPPPVRWPGLPAALQGGPPIAAPSTVPSAGPPAAASVTPPAAPVVGGPPVAVSQIPGMPPGFVPPAGAARPAMPTALTGPAPRTPSFGRAEIEPIPGGLENVAPAEFRAAVTPVVREGLALPIRTQIPEPQSLAGKAAKRTGETLGRLTSPESMAFTLGAGAAARALPAAVNLPGVAKALKESPQAAKVAEQTATAAVPVTIGEEAVRHVAPEAKKVFEGIQEADPEKIIEHGIPVLAGTAIAALAGRSGVKAAQEVGKAFPPAGYEPSASGVKAEAKAGVAEAAGRRLAAEAWSQRAQKIMAAKTGNPLPEPVELELDGKPVRVEYAGAGKMGRPNYRVVDQETGSTLVSGRGDIVQDFLRRGTQPQAQPELLTPEETAQVVEESMAKAGKPKRPNAPPAAPAEGGPAVAAPPEAAPITPQAAPAEGPERVPAAAKPVSAPVPAESRYDRIYATLARQHPDWGVGRLQEEALQFAPEGPAPTPERAEEAAPISEPRKEAPQEPTPGQLATGGPPEAQGPSQTQPAGPPPTLEVPRATPTGIPQDRTSGWTNIPLDERGREVAQQLAQRSAAKGGFDAVYTSDTRRAADSAEPVAQASGTPLVRTPALRAINLAEAEGKTSEETKPLLEQMIQNPDQQAPGGGESVNQFTGRLFPFLSKVIANQKKAPNRRVLLMTHSRDLEWMQGKPLQGDIPPGAVFRVEGDVPGQLTLHPVDLASENPYAGGIYVARHGQTPWDKGDATLPGTKPLGPEPKLPTVETGQPVPVTSGAKPETPPAGPRAGLESMRGEALESNVLPAIIRSAGAIHLNRIAQDAEAQGFPRDEVVGALTRMELAGTVTRLPGDQYRWGGEKAGPSAAPPQLENLKPEGGPPARETLQPKPAKPLGPTRIDPTAILTNRDRAAIRRLPPAKRNKLLLELRRETFQPGNVVRSYGGEQDTVLSYQEAPGKPYDWSVTVRGEDGRERTHKTEPDLRELPTVLRRAPAAPPRATMAPKAEPPSARPTTARPTPAAAAAAAAGEPAPASEPAAGPVEPAAPPAVLEPRSPSREVGIGASTKVRVPGTQVVFHGNYVLRHEADVEPSHNPATYEKNPAYQHVNERDYAAPENATRIAEMANRFDEAYLLSESPDAINGPPVIDRNGNVLGGNGREMARRKAMAQNPAAEEQYRAELVRKAAQFGVDPTLAAQPRNFLYRQVESVDDPQRAISLLNRPGTAALRPSEQAVSGGAMVSPQTMEMLSRRLGSAGENASLADVMRQHPQQILDRLIEDGVISKQERQGLLDDRGQLTAPAKDRISKLLLGRFFEDPEQLLQTPPALRNKLERIVAPVAKVDAKSGWEISPKVREAIGILDEMRGRGIKSLPEFLPFREQQGTLGAKPEPFNPDAIAIAQKLQDAGPRAVAEAFNRYATASEPADMFGARANPEEAFRAAFPVSLPGGRFGQRLAFEEVGELRLSNLFRSEGPKASYLGVFSRAAGAIHGGLPEVRAASEEVHAAALRFAGSRDAANTIMRQAIPAVTKAYDPDGKHFKAPVEAWNHFATVLADSRLQGARNRWLRFAEAVQGLDPAIAYTQFAEAFRNDLTPILAKLEGAGDFDEDVLGTAQSLFDQQKFPLLKQYLSDTFETAAGRVTRLLDDQEFQSRATDPNYQAAKAIYKRDIEPVLIAAHARNEGIFSRDLGPEGTYFPLMARTEEGETVHGIAGEKVPYKAPRNPDNYFTTGLSPAYTTDTLSFAHEVFRALRSNDKAALIETLKSEGVAKPLGRGEAPKTIQIGGVEYTASTVPAGRERVIVENGKAIRVAAPRLLVPAAIRRELYDMLEADNWENAAGQSKVKGLLNALTEFSIAGILEPTIHSQNLIGGVAQTAPFLRESLLGKAFDTLLPSVSAVLKIINTGFEDEATYLKDVREMADQGLLHPRSASMTYSREQAALTGATLVGPAVIGGPPGTQLRHAASLAPLLFGQRGIDTLARVVLYRASKALGNKTASEHYDFVSALGEYHRDMQGKIGKAIKYSGFSPFYTAGVTFQRMGIRAVTGGGPIPKNMSSAQQAGIRLQRMLKGVGLGLVLWAALYRAYRGKWPWQERESRLLAIPVKPEHQKTRIGRILFGDARGAYFGLHWRNPMMMRGLRFVGLRAMYDTWRAGGNDTQIADAMQKDFYNSLAHPISNSPIVRAGFIMVTGSEPFLVAMRDSITGRVAPQLRSALAREKQKASGLAGVAARAEAAALAVNGFVGNMAGAMGFGRRAEEMEGRGDPYVRSILDLVLPGMVQPPYNIEYQERRLQREQRILRRPVRMAPHQRAEVTEGPPVPPLQPEAPMGGPPA